jgi:hypothetical protein
MSLSLQPFLPRTKPVPSLPGVDGDLRFPTCLLDGLVRSAAVGSGAGLGDESAHARSWSNDSYVNSRTMKMSRGLAQTQVRLLPLTVNKQYVPRMSRSMHSGLAAVALAQQFARDMGNSLHRVSSQKAQRSGTSSTLQ